MPEAERQRVHAAALEVVENQLRDDDPPETRETFDRLVGEGHTEAEAKRLIAAVVLAEIGEVLQTNAPFNHSRFVIALDRLGARGGPLSCGSSVRMEHPGRGGCPDRTKTP